MSLKACSDSLVNATFVRTMVDWDLNAVTETYVTTHRIYVITNFLHFQYHCRKLNFMTDLWYICGNLWLYMILLSHLRYLYSIFCKVCNARIFRLCWGRRHKSEAVVLWKYLEKLQQNEFEKHFKITLKKNSLSHSSLNYHKYWSQLITNILTSLTFWSHTFLIKNILFNSIKLEFFWIV